MNRSLRDYEVLSFDCYGTLIDWESGIWTALQPMLLANDATGQSAGGARRVRSYRG